MESSKSSLDEQLTYFELVVFLNEGILACLEGRHMFFGSEALVSLRKKPILMQIINNSYFKCELILQGWVGEKCQHFWGVKG